MLIHPIRRLTLLTALSLGIAMPAVAQGGPRVTSSAGIGATVTILNPPLTTDGTRPLLFGSIVPTGAPVTVLPSSAASGEFRISGVSKGNISSLTTRFTFPSTMTGPGGATMPLNFNGTYAAVCEIETGTTCLAGSYVEYNPVTTPAFVDTPTRTNPGKPKFEKDGYAVFIGGQVVPSLAQRPGVYTATINVTITPN